MTFLRTDAGLSNQALFLDVDFIIYIEGKDGVSGGAMPPDEIFWKTVIGTYNDEAKYTFKGLGGKPALKAIAEKVADGSVTKSIVCMDADFDRQHGTAINHSNVMYTYGYSWENDVITVTALAEMTSLITTITPEDADLLARLESSIAQLSKIGHRIGPLDIECQKQGLPIQNKDKPGELLLLPKNKPPTFCGERIIAKIAKVKKTCSVAAATREGYVFIRHYHGKTVLLACYHMICALSKQLGNFGSIGTDVFRYNLLRYFSRYYPSYSDDMREHYRTSVQKVC